MLKPPQPTLTVANASLAFGGLRALNGVSLELYAGQLLGLLGPNGAGKSTLIRCIAGRQPLDRGEIRIHGQANAAAVGVVPQEIAIYRDLTVEQNLKFFGKLHGITDGSLTERVTAALAWADLGDKRRGLASQLSGGMQRRLNIACSVLHQPPVLLLDEPTVGVDPQSRERIYDMLDSLLDDGTAILLTTHQLDEAQHRCDRIAIIDHGSLVDIGSFEELVERTIGRAQHLSVRFTRAPRLLPSPLQATNNDGEAFAHLRDIGGELPILLKKLKLARAEIESMTLRGPTLHHVFLHMTGRELRE